MRMARWFVVFVMAVVLGSPLKSDAQSPILANDAAEIHAALGGIQSAWNHHDMTAFVSYMTDDVEWVNIVGMCWRGKAQVFLAHGRTHRTTFKDRQWHDAETTELRLVAPGVVIVTQAIPMDGFSSPNGSPTPPNRNMLTLVFVHRDGRWLVAEGHNTVIDPQAAAHDPGK
jgi:uncharacterized protein (TIGR02246 family)